MRTSPTLLSERHELLRLGGRLGLRLLDEDVLAGGERLLCELVMRDDRGREHDRVQLRVGQELLEVGRRLRVGMAGRGFREQVWREVAEPAQVSELAEVPGQVRSPVAEPRLAYAQRRHSFHTFPFDVPFAPVAFRRSTTSGACSTSSS